MYPCKVSLKPGSGRAFKSGGAWIYDNEVARVEGNFTNGDLVTVLDHDGYPLGNGFMNLHSKLRVRMMTRNAAQEIDDAFLRARIEAAVRLRKQVIDTGACRLIFGEADFLPGLTVDKFNDVLVLESLALGMDRMKERGLKILLEVLSEEGLPIRGVYERSDAKERLKEGMERVKGFLSEPFDTKVQICENGVHYWVDVAEGQKTGFFLDQKLNRRAVQGFSHGARVLDCFTHTGSFALNAGLAGAREVLGVDASALGVSQATENAALNGLSERVRFETADVFELLPRLEAAGERFDLVILDPPAFTKSRDTVKRAVKGYRDINLRGMKLVRDGGFLATCSCSHFMEQALFAKTIQEAARGARKRLRQVYFSTQAPDHPILWAAGETYYLKFFIFQVLEEK